MAEGALRELLAVFGVKVDNKELKEADKGIEALAEKLEHFGPQLAKIGKGIAEAFGAEKLKEFISEGIEAATHVQNLANKLDVSAEQLQLFADVAKGAGVDLDSAAVSLGKLQKNLGAAEIKGGESAAAFAKLGISATEAAKTPLPDLLGEISEGLSKLPDHNQKAAAAIAIFGRSGAELLPILGRGKEALNEMLQEVDALGSGLGDQFYADAKKASEAFEHFGIGIRSLKERALDAILPAVTLLGNALTKIVEGALALDKQTHLLSTGMVVLAGVIAVGLVDALGAAAAAAWAFAAPFIIEFGPIIAAVAGVVWVVQDLWNLMTGGPSIIGNLIEKFGGLGEKKKVIEGLRDVWTGVVDAMSDVAYGVGYVIGVLVGLGKVVGGLDVVTGFFTGLVEIVIATSRALLGLVQTVLAIPKALKSGSFDPITKAIDKTGDAIFGKKGSLGVLGLGQTSSDVTQHGVPQAAVDEWNRHHTGHEATTTKGERLGAVRKTANPNITSRPILVARPTAHLPAGGGRGGEGHRSVEQHVVNHVQVHTSSDQPEAVGNAVGAGVATADQKALNAALASIVKP